MSADCLSADCRGKIPAKRIFEDELSLCFADINPQAPTHLLTFPKCHCSTAQADGACAALGHMVAKAAALARAGSMGDTRIVINTGVDGGQTVDHLICICWAETHDLAAG